MLPPFKIKLRPHQVLGRDQTRDMLKTHSAVLLVACTGYGKTIVAADIAKSASGYGRRVMIMAHRDTLIKQMSRKLDECGVDHGIIMAAFTPSPRKLVQVASVQTFVRRIDKLLAKAEAINAECKKDGRSEVERIAALRAAGAWFDILMIDEAHLSAAKSYMAIIAKLRLVNPWMKIIGLTGSPCRLDGKGLGVSAGGCFDVMVESAHTKDLVEASFLVRPVVYAPSERLDLSGVKKTAGDYDSDALAELMDKPKITGSAIEQYQLICPGVPAVAWCANVAHAKHVADEFNAAGIKAVALSGDDDGAERDRVLAALASGEIKVVSFAMLLVEGVDCPAIGAIIMLRPTMSLSSYLQTIGRGLRPIYADGMPLESLEERIAAIMAGPKGPKCFILDHAGLTFKHGFADEVREWSLEGVIKKKGTKKKEPTLDLKQCPKCFIVHPPEPTCPGCGHVYKTAKRELEHVDGTLEEITPEMQAAMSKKKKQEVQKARTLEELEAIAKERGYKEGWAKHTMEVRKKASAKYGSRRPEPPIEVYFNDL